MGTDKYKDGRIHLFLITFFTHHQVYLDKLSELKETGDAVKMRKAEHEGRPKAEEALRTTIVHFRKFLDERAAGEPKYAHITDEEAKTVEDAISKHEGFVNSKSAEQSKRAKFENPVLTVAELESAKVKGEE